MFLFATCLALVTFKQIPKEPEPNNVPSVSSVILTPSNTVLTDQVDRPISQNEKNSKEVYLKLLGGTNLEGYQVE